MVKIKLATLHAAAPNKPAGYLDDVMAKSRLVEGGRAVAMTEADYLALCAKYRQAGDAVARVAKPLARAIDRAFGTRLENCGGCAARHRRWNRGAAAVTPEDPSA